MKQMPTDYAVVMVRAAFEQGVDLLEGMSISRDELESLEFFPLDDYMEVLGRFTALQTDSDWGFRRGHAFTMANHGPLGFGAVSAPTIRDGLVFLARYMATRASYTVCRIEVHRENFHIVFEHDGEMARFLQRICETLSMIFQSYIESVGGSTAPTVWRFPYPEPDNLTDYERWIHGGFSFDADALRLEVPGSVGMVPSPFRNDAAYKSTMAQCEAILIRASSDPVIDRVRGFLASHIERRITERVPVTEIPVADEVAGHLRISRRTLIRRLKEAGTSFQALKDQLVREQLRALLSRPELSMSEIAERLGYADAANFTRACRRMFGTTPTKLRLSPPV